MIPIYKLKGCYSFIDHQIFTISAISIFGLGLYYWLKLLHKNTRAILFSVLVISVSFKIVETMRFPNAIHAAAWYPWIFYGITKIFQGRSLRQIAGVSVALIFFFICLVTAGYPYFVYYSLFLIPPYILLFFFKTPRTFLFSIDKVHWKQLLPIAGSALVAGLLCLPYLLSVLTLMGETYNRSGNDFDYSTGYNFNIEDTVGSLIYPPFAQMEGWFFFSIAGVLLIILLFGMSTFKNKQLRSFVNPPIPLKIIIVFLSWFFIISYITYGHESYLFRLLWHVLPGFSSLRVWGRMNIIFTPVLAWLLVYAYDFFEQLSFKRPFRIKTISMPSLIIAVSYCLIFGLQLYLFLSNRQDNYWRYLRGPIGNFKGLFLITGFVSSVIILLFIQWGAFLKNRLKHPHTVMLCFLVGIAAAEMWPVGAHTWVMRKSFGPSAELQSDPVLIHEGSFKSPRISDRNTARLSPVYTVGLASRNWYFKRYVDFLQRTENEVEDRKILLGIVDARKIFISGSLKHDTIGSFLNDTSRYPDTGSLVFYDGDELIWKITMPQDGYLSFIDNWDPYWEVTVDDHKKNIELLFGTFKAVYLEKGEHRVHFMYKPTLTKTVFELRQKPFYDKK
ncbi:MAG: hypothetical protein JW925_05770 [Syntrophaceae bacterium]|nr:hypothetical protein [Syntrophaceae bacterium]